jgi:pilus assembly protein CpaC
MNDKRRHTRRYSRRILLGIAGCAFIGGLGLLISQGSQADPLIDAPRPEARGGGGDEFSPDGPLNRPDARTPAAMRVPTNDESLQNGLVASVLRPAAGTESLKVAKDKSALIALKRPISRAAITQPGIADVVVLSPTELVVTGQNFGVTQLVLWGQDGGQQIYEVVVEIDVTLLEKMIREMAPRSSVQVRSLLGTLVLSGFVSDAKTADQIGEVAELFNPGRVKNQITVAGVQQVLIRCTVAEVNRSALRELNMNWFFGGSPLSRDFFFSNNIDNLNPSVVASSGLANLLQGQQTYALLPNANLGTTNITLGFPRAELQFFIQALRENGLVRVLAEPNLIALSGQKATFLAGGEVPVPIAQFQNTISVEYKQFGVLLEFTPNVVGGQMIRLTVAPEISQIDETTSVVLAGFAIPGFSTRRAETTVEVGNGQTFAVAGLLNDTVRATARKLPGLGDLPVLGTLFSSVQYQRNETELVILVTPELVSPLDPQQVGPVPGEGMRDPNDYELFLTQTIEVPPVRAPETGVPPRHDFPVRVYPGETAGGASSGLADGRMNMALKGPYGMSFGEERDER